MMGWLHRVTMCTCYFHMDGCLPLGVGGSFQFGRWPGRRATSLVFTHRPQSRRGKIRLAGGLKKVDHDIEMTNTKQEQNQLQKCEAMHSSA